MSHSPFFDRLRDLVRLSRVADRLGCSVDDARGEVTAHAGLSRRQLLGGGLGVAATAAVGTVPFSAKAGPVRGHPRIAIVGAGLAGLVCADQLARRGLRCRIYEASPLRLGGRVFTDHHTFPGQVSECGGEMIDTLHTTMRQYAQEFGLAREDYVRAPGTTRYHFFGSLHDESEVVAQWRELAPRLRADYQSISAGGPTFFSHSAADEALDHTDLASYLYSRAADLPLIREVLCQAYISEYGLEPHEQSSLNFLQFIHLDRRSDFQEFGGSDERFHLIGGNDGLVNALAARLTETGTTITQGARLTRLARNASGEFLLSIGGVAAPEVADVVVIAIPFSVLRGVTLDASLGLSADKLRCIRELGYGNNAKTAVRFNRRVWAEQGSDGLAYADLTNVQNTWETNWLAPGRGDAGILTDYAGGERGLEIQLASPAPTPYPSYGAPCGACHSPAPPALGAAGRTLVNSQAEAFVSDLDRIFPGIAAAASRGPDGRLIARRSHWTPQGFSKGSYTAYLPGQFTTLAGLEGQAAGLLKFAGEHTDSFYEYQGFMEGACNSGIRAAAEVIDDIRNGRV